MSFYRYILLFFGLSLCLSSTSSGDDVQDYWSFVDQYQLLDRVQLDCVYTRAMTLNPSVDVYINAEARGPYQYIVSGEGFRVEADVAGLDESGAMLEQRGVYSFDGSLYRIYLHRFDTSEDRSSEPFAGADFPLNPLLFPAAMLRSDLDEVQLLDVRHFRSRQLIEQNVQSIKIERDVDSHAYLHIQLDPKRNLEYSDKVDSHYRVYMEYFEGLGDGKKLPARLEVIQDSVVTGTIRIDSYVEFQAGDETVFFPSACSFVLIEGDEATIEYRVDDIVYSRPPSQGDVFGVGHVASNHIDTEGVLNEATQLPEGAQDISVETKTPHTANNGQANYVLKTITVSVLALISIVAWVVIRRLRSS